MTALWHRTWEDGLQPFPFQGEEPIVVIDPTDANNKVLFCSRGPGQNDPSPANASSNRRSEIIERGWGSQWSSDGSRMFFEEDYWIGLRFRLPPDTVERPDSFHSIYQVHESRSGFGVPLIIHVNPPSNAETAANLGHFVLYCYGKQGPGHPLYRALTLGPHNIGQWNEMVIRMRFSDSGNGVFKIWQNGVKYVDLQNINNHWQRTAGLRGPYAKLGVYHSFNEQTNRYACYYDEYRGAAGPNATFADVDPSQGGVIVVPDPGLDPDPEPDPTPDPNPVPPPVLDGALVVSDSGADIVIQASQVPADMTDAVIRVDLADLPVTEFWGAVDNGGGDIRVYKADGTQLPRHVLACNTATRTGELRIKYTGVLSSSSNTTIWIRTSEGVEPDPTSAFGRLAVYSREAFYSLDGGITDHSGNVSPINFGAEAGAPSFINAGARFNGADGDYISLSGNPEVEDVFATGGTLFVRYKAASDGESDFGRIFSIATPSVNEAIRLFTSQESAGTYRLSFVAFGGLWYVTGLPIDQDADIVVPYDGSSQSNAPLIYVDGAVATVTQASPATTDYESDADLEKYIGNRPSLDREADGVVDEIGLARRIYTADEVLFNYNTQRNPQTFYTVSAHAGGAPSGGTLAPGALVRRGQAFDAGASSALSVAVSGATVGSTLLAVVSSRNADSGTPTVTPDPEWTELQGFEGTDNNRIVTSVWVRAATADADDNFDLAFSVDQRWSAAVYELANSEISGLLSSIDTSATANFAYPIVPCADIDASALPECYRVSVFTHTIPDNWIEPDPTYPVAARTFTDAAGGYDVEDYYAPDDGVGGIFIGIKAVDDPGILSDEFSVDGVDTGSRGVGFQLALVPVVGSGPAESPKCIRMRLGNKMVKAVPYLIQSDEWARTEPNVINAGDWADAPETI